MKFTSTALEVEFETALALLSTTVVEACQHVLANDRSERWWWCVFHPSSGVLCESCMKEHLACSTDVAETECTCCGGPLAERPLTVFRERDRPWLALSNTTAAMPAIENWYDVTLHFFGGNLGPECTPLDKP